MIELTEQVQSAAATLETLLQEVREFSNDD